MHPLSQVKKKNSCALVDHHFVEPQLFELKKGGSNTFLTDFLWEVEANVLINTKQRPMEDSGDFVWWGWLWW